MSDEPTNAALKSAATAFKHTQSAVNLNILYCQANFRRPSPPQIKLGALDLRGYF
jgi:hypothetical protein